MTVYLSIFLAMAFLGLMVKTRGQQDGALAVVGVFLLVFMGTRNDTGCDFRAYYMRFQNLYHDSSYFSYIGEEEPGFHWLNLLVHNLGLNYMWLNLFASLIFVVCLIRFVRLSPAPMMLLSIMFPVVILQLGMSGLRQALATAFLLQAMISFVQVRRIQTGLWILLAAQFHHSAYMFLPLAMMAGRRFSWPMAVAAVAFLGPASVFLLGDRADVYSDRYVEQIYGENSSGGAVLRYALAVLPCILFEFHTKRMRAHFPKLFPLLRVSSLMTFALAPIGLLSTVALHRLTFYLLPVDLLIFVCTVMTMPKPKVLSREWLYAPAAVLLTYMVGWFTLSRHSSICYVPYDSFLF